jgi:aspartate 1-decarboxylase
MSGQLSYRVKRSCIHNVRVTASNMTVEHDLVEGLVLPREMMGITDIAPFEQIIVTKIGGDNWANRMYTFAIPGDSDAVEARGSISHLLKPGELCCVITGSQLAGDRYLEQLDNRCKIPIIDVRLYPDDPVTNDLGRAKTVIEYGDKFERVSDLPNWVTATRSELPRVLLSNLLSGLKVQEVEKRGCIEMSAELPIDYMKKAGFCKNQSIFVYNASRGGASAESYVVPSLSKKTVGISGALSSVADVGDVISEAGFVTTTEPLIPRIYDLLGAGHVDLSRYAST